MSDLGTLDTLAPQAALPLRVFRLERQFGGLVGRRSIDGAISGITRDKTGATVPYVLVCLFDRKAHALLARTRSASDGTFAFAGYDSTDDSRYYGIAFDPDRTEDPVAHERLLPDP